jgi:D-alanyl-D-alanine carboxypeptidase
MRISSSIGLPTVSSQRECPGSGQPSRTRRFHLLARVTFVLVTTLVLTAGGVTGPTSGHRTDAPPPSDSADEVEIATASDTAEHHERVGAARFSTVRGRLALIERVDERRETDVRTSRSGRRPERPVLPRWVSDCAAIGSHRALDHPNGRVSSEDLCRIPGTRHQLHHGAVRDYWRVNQAYARRFGRGLCITDSYRSYEAQQAVYGSKPGLAAVPGTSNHGWGIALDLCGGVESYYSETHRWLRVHGPRFGWVNPTWAQEGGSLPEPWHWEYVAR